MGGIARGTAGGTEVLTGGGGGGGCTGVAWCCKLPSAMFWTGGAGGELLVCSWGSAEVAYSSCSSEGVGDSEGSEVTCGGADAATYPEGTGGYEEGFCGATTSEGGGLGAGWMADGAGCDLNTGSYPKHSRLLFTQFLQTGWVSSHWNQGACQSKQILLKERCVGYVECVVG